MKQPRLTQSRFDCLHPAAQLQAYCTHPNNLVFHRNRPDGLSVKAQADLTNDWRDTLFRFSQTLPSK